LGRLCVGVACIATPLSAQRVDSTAPSLKVSGYLQPRFQASGDSAAFVLRRARIALEGSVTPWASYRAQIELRTAGAPATPPASPLTLSATDLFIRLTHGRWGGTAGQFRVPFSLEALLSSTMLETTERSRIVNAAKRDIGLQVDWHLRDRLLLQGAVVNGDGPNRAANPDSRMAYFGRVTIRPVAGLDVGGAFEGYSDSTGMDLQAVYRAARWTTRAEYIRERNRRTDVRAAGWYALAGYGVVPQRVEVVARIEQFDPNDQIATDRSTGYLLGAQYFFRGDTFKVMGDYELFREQAVQVDNDRGVVQLQVRW